MGQSDDVWLGDGFLTQEAVDGAVAAVMAGRGTISLRELRMCLQDRTGADLSTHKVAILQMAEMSVRKLNLPTAEGVNRSCPKPAAQDYAGTWELIPFSKKPHSRGRELFIKLHDATPAAGWGSMLVHVAPREVSFDQSPDKSAVAGSAGSKFLIPNNPGEVGCETVSVSLLSRRFPGVCVTGMGNSMRDFFGKPGLWHVNHEQASTAADSKHFGKSTFLKKALAGFFLHMCSSAVSFINSFILENMPLELWWSKKHNVSRSGGVFLFFGILLVCVLVAHWWIRPSEKASEPERRVSKQEPGVWDPGVFADPVDLAVGNVKRLSCCQTGLRRDTVSMTTMLCYTLSLSPRKFLGCSLTSIF